MPLRRHAREPGRGAPCRLGPALLLGALVAWAPIPALAKKPEPAALGKLATALREAEQNVVAG